LFHDHHQPPTTKPQGDPQARTAALARQAARVRRRGRGPDRGREAAGWPPSAVYVAEGSGLDGIAGRAARAAPVSQLGSGRARSASTAALGRAAGRAASRCGASNDPGNVGTVIRARARVRRRLVALGPGSADPYGHKAVRASMGALFSVPVAACARRELPGRASRSSPARACR
jgi:TrmH family RNA methyltransferase